LPVHDRNTVVGHHGAPSCGRSDDPATPAAREGTRTPSRSRGGHVLTPPGRAWLPAEPLAAAVSASGGIGTLLRGRRRTTEGERLARAYYRALKRGWITVAAGDELACNLLGVHPSAIWGQRFWVGAA
jgi:hypothetical protein